MFEAPHANALSAPLEIAWKRGGDVQYFTLNSSRESSVTQEFLPLNSNAVTSLGSLWKLFIYIYIVDKERYIPDYQCTSSSSNDEDVFCCDTAKSIDANEALVKSCGPFFEPSRLSIKPAEWQAYWRPLLPPSARWLTNLDALHPDTTVTISSLLDALSSIPSRPRQQAERALASLFFTSRAEGIVSSFGGRLHVKTWTWNHLTRKHIRVGGFAGWLADGTPIWVRGEGSSGQVIRHNASTLSRWLDTLPWQQKENECVVVRYFTAYPLKQVTDIETKLPAGPGILNGRYRPENPEQRRTESVRGREWITDNWPFWA